MRWFNLGSFIVLKSSENCYHVVFNRAVSWQENMKIVAWVSLLSHNDAVLRWFQMQCIKGSSTLRVSPKMDKPSPRIVCRFGKQDGEVRNYLQYRRRIKKVTREYINSVC